MYSLNQIKKGINNPSLIVKLVKRNMIKFINRSILRKKGVLFVEKDWDNLIILDACRYDLFKDVNNLPGNLTYKYSIASNTNPFLKKNFANKNFSDIVLGTATPKYTENNLTSNFYEIFQLWKNKWDDELRTLPPGKMTKEVIKISKKFPNKKILAHYVQPHQPFIGKTGRNIPHEVRFSEEIIEMDTHLPNIWEALEEEKIPVNKVKKAYKENLELTLPHIKNLIKTLKGKTVVTSDHGNAFGEWGYFGHPGNCHIDSLIKVPWLEYTNGDRKSITEGSVKHSEREKIKEIAGKLQI